MRLFLCLIAILSLTAFAFADHAPDMLFVKLRDPVQVSSLDGQLRTQSQIVNDAISQSVEATQPFAVHADLSRQLERIIGIRFESSMNVSALARDIAGESDVEWVAFNNYYNTVQALDEAYEPMDSLYGDAWWLHKISAGLAWELSRGDSNVLIGIIDTGIDHTHRDLRNNIWHNCAEVPDNGIDDDHNGFIDDVIGWDFVDAPSLPAGGDYLVRDNDPMDDMGHGTYVAGCAAATSDNPDCYPSIGFNCRLMPLRAGNANGTLEEDDIAAALLYGAANGAAIINMSFGDVVASPLLREVVSIVHAAGVVLVASAGNAQNGRIHYPSGFPEVIAVGATDQFDRRASFSNFGPSVDIMAPGVDILSTILGGTCGAWIFTGGTSYASPIVAGVAGLMLSVNPQLSTDDILDILKSSADDLNISGWDSATVSGRVNARRALESARFGAEAEARILTPASDAGVRGEFAVVGVAAGTAFESFTVEYGLGENPRSWLPAAFESRRVLNDTLALITAPAEDTVLVVRLNVFATTGAQNVDMGHFYVQNGPPSIDSLQTRLVLDGPGYAKQILAWSNQIGRASLLMTNAAGDSIREDFGYVSEEHVAVISQNRYAGNWTAVLQVTNLLGETARSEAFPYSSVQTGIRPFHYNTFVTTMPHGIVCNLTSDYDCDGNEEVWLLPVDNLNFVDTLEPFEWNGSDFLETENTYGAHIPQWIGDADNDGLIEMAARRGVETRIWEQSNSCSMLNSLVFQSPDQFSQFLVGRYVLIDSASERKDILARTSTENGPRMALFQVDADFTVSLRDTLPNLSDGSNLLGPPGSAVGDFDNDGRFDIIYGDYDGDLIWCEWNGTRFEEVWTTRLRQNDATNWMATGDFDCDGVDELVAGCRANASASSESQRLLMGWDYYVFETTGDNQLSGVDSVQILGNENVTFNPASVAVADVNGDECDDILISAYPDFYVVTRNESTGRYEPEWHYFPSEAGGLVVSDFNDNGVNEIVMSDGEQLIRIENSSVFSHAPFPPVLSGYPADETTLSLSWTPIAGAIHYELYAARGNENYFLLTATAETSFVWSEGLTDSTYRVAVSTYDTTYEQPLSIFSNILELTPNSPPLSQDSAQQVAPRTVAVSFNEPMNSSVFVQGNWRLADGEMPAVIAESENMSQVFLSFDSHFLPGAYTLFMRNLRDAQGTPLPLPEREVVFVVEDGIATPPYVVTHRLVDPPVGTRIEIEFSESMSDAASNPSSYSVSDPRRGIQTHPVNEVRSMGAGSTRYEVELDSHYPVGAVGVDVHILIAPIASADGDVLEQTTLLISQAAADISEAYVYPNPFRGRGAAGTNGVFFAALPRVAVIRIFALDGTLLRKIQHNSPTGHTQWDLRTQDGNEVASGIYLYTIEANGEEKMGKLAVMR